MSQAPPSRSPSERKKNATNTMIVIVAVVIILVSGGFLVGIMWPAGVRDREIANRTVSGANLKSAFTAMYSYSASNDDQFPAHVGMLLADGSMGPKSFTSPSHSEDASGISYAGQAPPSRYYRFGDYLWVYEGLGESEGIGGEVDAPFDAILAFGLSHDGDGRNVLFADGHVEFMDPASFEQALRNDAKARAKFGLPPIDLAALGESGP